MQSPTADLCRRSDDAGKEEFSSCSAQETGVEMISTTLEESDDRINALKAENVLLSKRLNGLRELCGHVEDGSSCVLKIFQDDATKDWFIKQDDKRLAYGRSFESVVDAAMKELT